MPNALLASEWKMNMLSVKKSYTFLVKYWKKQG